MLRCSCWKHNLRYSFCHSCMRSCILRSWASQAHTCPSRNNKLKTAERKKKNNCMTCEIFGFWNFWMNQKQPCTSRQSMIVQTVGGCPEGTSLMSCDVHGNTVLRQEARWATFLCSCVCSKARVTNEERRQPSSVCVLCTLQTHAVHTVGALRSVRITLTCLPATNLRPCAQASTAQRAETRGLTSTSHFRRARSHLSLLVMLLKLSPTRERHVCFLLQSGKMCSAGELTGPLPV